MPAMPRLSADDALARVLAPGQSIVLAQGPGMPRTLVDALPRHLDRLAGSRLMVGMVTDDFPVLPGVEICTFFPSGVLGSVSGMRSRSARYLPVSMFEFAHGLRTARYPVDVALIQATTERDGRVSLGLNVDFALPAADNADHIVAEVIDDLPWTGPQTTTELDHRVSLVASAHRAVVADRAPASDTSRRIGEEAARWIPDGATLELGMGRTLDALTAPLRGRRELRIHSGIIGDWLTDLRDAGALADRHRPVATAAVGSPEFYAWLSHSAGAGLKAADITHGPAGLAALPRLHAVNSVLQVDLSGRANSERGLRGRLGGIGGLRDFARAAAGAQDGLSIIALPSSISGQSRIVADLPPDARTLEPADVDVVVTEYGSADLRGVYGDDRAAALVNVAAPGHRAALLSAYRRITARQTTAKEASG
jgi:acyl-CoA hydrolase